MSWLPWRKRNGSKNIAKAASWFQLPYRAGLDPRKLGRLSASCPWTEKIPVFSENLFGCTENSEHMVWREDWWAGVWSETDSRDGDCNPPPQKERSCYGVPWAEQSSVLCGKGASFEIHFLLWRYLGGGAQQLRLASPAGRVSEAGQGFWDLGTNLFRRGHQWNAGQEGKGLDSG